jgi:hypothetical protein
MTTDLGPTARDWLGKIAPDGYVYQEAVQRLTSENRRLREALGKEEANHKQDVKVLRAQLREGLSPELMVLRREIRQWRERALAAEGRFREVVKRGEAAT